jgi:hypothetical protein
MSSYLGFYALFTLTGCALACLVWTLSRRIGNSWLRQVPRSLAIAGALTPTLVGIHGTGAVFPMPALWVLMCGVFPLGDSYTDDSFANPRAGIFLLAGFAVILLFSLIVIYARRRSNAA